MSSKGDSILFAESADLHLFDLEGEVALFWFNFPKKGKCLFFEGDTTDPETFQITVEANYKAKRYARKLRKLGLHDAPREPAL